MLRFFHWLAKRSVEKRALVAAFVVAISSVAMTGYVRPSVFHLNILKGEQDSESQADREIDEQQSVSPISLSDADVVIVVEGEDFFTNESLEALRDSVNNLEALEQVAGVLWMGQLPVLNIFGLDDPLLPRSKASQNRLQKSREKAMFHPLVNGQLLSDDGRTLLIMVRLNYLQVHDDDDATTALKDSILETLKAHPETDFRVRVTGRIPSAIAKISTHEANQLKYRFLGFGTIFVMSLILFRGIRAVVIVGLAPAFGVFWTLGFIQFLGYDRNPFIDVVLPVLVSLVGLTDGVHLMVQIRKLRARGQSINDAAIDGLGQVGLACFLTSLTTAIGFGSLMLVDSLWVQQFALCSVVGAVLCFISVVTIIPLACSSPLGNGIEAGQESGVIDRNLHKIRTLVDLVIHNRNIFAWTGIALTIICFGVALSLRPDQRVLDYLPQSDESTQALLHVDEAFGGLEFSSVEIRWNRNVECDDPLILKVTDKVDKILQSEELIGRPLSIKNLIDAQPGSGPPEERMSLLDLLPPPLKTAFHSPERSRTVVNFRVHYLGIAAYRPVFDRIETELAELRKEHPDFEFRLTGRAVWRSENLYQVVVDCALSLGTASVMTWLVLTCVFKSIRLGLISIVPNLFPLAITGTCLAFAGHNLEIVMVCSFTVCLGIAVDDTIHFMTRYLDERRRLAASGKS
ncbi:MAG: MMPL family transporter, partial [Planctomycetota bacterium]